MCQSMEGMEMLERNTQSEEQIPSDICMLSPEQLHCLLVRFVLEVRKKDGTEYPLDILYHIGCGIMRFLNQNGQPEIDFLKEQADFRVILDTESKKANVGSHKTQAKLLTQEEEDLLWEKGLLRAK